MLGPGHLDAPFPERKRQPPILRNIYIYSFPEPRPTRDPSLTRRPPLCSRAKAPFVPLLPCGSLALAFGSPVLPLYSPLLPCCSPFALLYSLFTPQYSLSALPGSFGALFCLFNAPSKMPVLNRKILSPIFSSRTVYTKYFYATLYLKICFPSDPPIAISAGKFLLYWGKITLRLFLIVPGSLI